MTEAIQSSSGDTWFEVIIFIAIIILTIWLLYGVSKYIAILKNWKESKSDFVKIRITVISITLYTIGLFAVSMFFLPITYHKLMSIIISLSIANLPILLFIFDLSFYKDNFLNGITIDITTKESITLRELSWQKSECVYISSLFLYYAGWTLTHIFTFLAILIWIYFTSLMMTQIVRFYIYWSERIIDNSSQEACELNETRFENFIEAINMNYRISNLIMFFLFIYLTVISSATGMKSYLYSMLFFSWLLLFIITGLLFDKKVDLLQTLQIKLFDGQKLLIKNSLQNQIYFMKFLFVLFLFMEIFMLGQAMNLDN